MIDRSEILSVIGKLHRVEPPPPKPPLPPIKFKRSYKSRYSTTLVCTYYVRCAHCELPTPKTLEAFSLREHHQLRTKAEELIKKKEKHTCEACLKKSSPISSEVKVLSHETLKKIADFETLCDQLKTEEAVLNKEFVGQIFTFGKEEEYVVTNVGYDDYQKVLRVQGRLLQKTKRWLVNESNRYFANGTFDTVTFINQKLSDRQPKLASKKRKS